MPTDPTAVVALLEIAAICLTDHPESDFSFEELLAEARYLGGDEFPIAPAEARDALATSDIVVPGPEGMDRMVGVSDPPLPKCTTPESDEARRFAPPGPRESRSEAHHRVMVSRVRPLGL